MSACRKPIPFDGLVVCDGSGAMSFDVTVLLGVYDEFANISAGRIALAGTAAISLLDQTAFGRQWQLAVALLTAHRLAIAYNIAKAAEGLGKNDQSSTNETTSISASTSSLSEGYSQLALANANDAFTTDLARTGYGLELLALIETLIPAGEIVHGAPLGRQQNAAPWPVSAGY